MPSHEDIHELTYAIECERAWRKRMDKLYNHYCESQSPEWHAVRNVGFAYKQLADALMDYDREGYEVQKDAQP